MFRKNKIYKFKILSNPEHACHPTLARLLVPGEIVYLFITNFSSQVICFKVVTEGKRYPDNSISRSAIKLIDNCKFITMESLSYIIESDSFVRSKYVS